MKRATRMVLILASIVALAGCAGLPQDGTRWLSDAAKSSPTRHVIVTVPNETSAAASLGVGSTPRGYNSIAPSYTVSAEARRQARALADRHQLQMVASWPIAVLDVYCLVYRIADRADRQIVLAALKLDPHVESAQALEVFTTQSQSLGKAHYNDTYAGLQRNLDELAIPEAQQWSRGQGVRVAVIDTGVAVDHVDLQGRVAAWNNFVDADVARFRADRHGTAVAGVIAAVANNGLGIVGIAPEVRLWAYKACWESEQGAHAKCNTFTLAQALAAAIEARVDIVNLSLAGPSDPLLTRLVRSGQRAGMIFVGAAPPVQKKTDSPVGFPLEIEGVVGVEASESSTPARGFIAAPGEDIFTLMPGNHYDVASGSSLAAAEVSAMIALMRTHDAGLRAQQARRLLDDSLRPVRTAAGTRPAINACEAVAALQPQMSCIGAMELIHHAGERRDALYSARP